jgi:hypothetical protein
VHEAEPLACPILLSIDAALARGPAAAADPADPAAAPAGARASSTMKIGLNLWFTDLPSYPRPEMGLGGDSLGYAAADVQEGH